MKNFYQEGPSLTNTFESDEILKKFLTKVLPPDCQREALPHLAHLGQRAVTDMLDWAQEAEAQPPVHVPFDPWGRRIDDIKVSNGWKQLEKVAAEEGIVATAYERRFGAFSRVYQMALLYIYSPSSAIFSCPLAMTDGAARALELYGTPELKTRGMSHLLSKDSTSFWTAGQWMTERTGGSDVSGTSTDAHPYQGQSSFGATHTLHGTKWFTSATTSQMALTLARPAGAPAGSRGLSLFYLELRNNQGQLNNIQIHRLKDKLGTKALPTAELSLQGTPARMMGGEGEGVKRIASVLNITRIYNSMCAVGHMRRALDLAQSYSKKRTAFGKLLIDHPLHRETLRWLEEDFRHSFAFSFLVAHLLGKEEVGEISAAERTLLRTLTPVLKLYTAKKAMIVSSEVVEIFGGAGYVEDTGLPRLVRDGQVFSIWEGTTNVLALDMLRAFEKEQSLPVVMEYLKNSPAAKANQPKFMAKWTVFQELVNKLNGNSPETWESNARQLALSLGDVMGEAAVYNFEL
ncbi:acyl-CoA dehydrogenase family protein [Bdellovibrio svalbardensis]|uniref:Acyl-CoA dehydrogenase family protein n=1 Tax=Bdellovibrio svalbardensis TaxID=2972972 RepID=A0ABT6DHM4_9BACT|nr:acyl-CoA dehydrogenase family protein [Bdellovibrio svalbardensis]MDG0815750.1 acyl-CoA dehydrogenase family protein [Bdellovibrio svalbardensis]